LGETARPASRLLEHEPLLRFATAEQANSAPEHHRNHRKRQIVDESRFEELPNDVAAVDVDVANAVTREPLDHRLGLAGEKLLAVASVDRTAGENDAPLTRVRPSVETERRIVGFAADDESVDRVEERLVTVVLAFQLHRVEPIERAVRSRDVTVDA